MRLQIKCSRPLDCLPVADCRRRTLKRRTSTVKSETASLPSYTHHHFPSPLSLPNTSLFLFSLPQNTSTSKSFHNGNFFLYFICFVCPVVPHGLSLPRRPLAPVPIEPLLPESRATCLPVIFSALLATYDAQSPPSAQSWRPPENPLI